MSSCHSPHCTILDGISLFSTSFKTPKWWRLCNIKLTLMICSTKFSSRICDFITSFEFCSFEFNKKIFEIEIEAFIISCYCTTVPRCPRISIWIVFIQSFPFSIIGFQYFTSPHHSSQSRLLCSRPPLPPDSVVWRHQAPDNGHNLITLWGEYKVCNGPYWKLSLSSQYEINIVLEMESFKRFSKRHMISY